MENPRPEKVAVVEEIKARFDEADAVLLTEYRGLNVSAISDLRRALRAAGGDYKIYKNTLVGFATQDLDVDLSEMLTGPTALAFVTTRDGVAGDAVTVAKALRDFARGNPNLVVKGGLLGESLLSADEAKALADVAPREELLARLAGGLAAPMVQFAGLLQALPRNFAYGLQALIDKGGAPGAPESEAPEADATTDTETAEAPAEADESTAEAPAEADESTAEAPAEADESTAEASAEAEASTAEAPEAEASTAEAPEAATDTAEAPEAEASTAEAPEAEATDDSPEEN